MASHTGGRSRRAIRRFTLGHGPLKRRTDRVQVAARCALAVAVGLAPAPAAAAVGAATTRLEAQAAQQVAERYRVDAVLLGDADRPADATAAEIGAAAVVPVRAGWWTPGGLEREGIVLVAPGSRAGSTEQVWLGPDGGQVAPPMTQRDVAETATVTGVLVLLGVPIGAWVLYAVLVLALDAHRAHRWAREWAAVEPRWGAQLW